MGCDLGEELCNKLARHLSRRALSYRSGSGTQLALTYEEPGEIGVILRRGDDVYALITAGPAAAVGFKIDGRGEVAHAAVPTPTIAAMLDAKDLNKAVADLALLSAF